MKRSCLALTLALATAASAVARADDVPEPRDHRVTCLDPATGQPRWEAALGPLGRPSLSIVGDRLVVDEPSVGRLELALATGTRLAPPAAGAPGTASSALTADRPLTWPGHGALELGPGTTSDLIVAGPTRRTVLALETRPEQLVVVGDHAIFSLASALSPVGHGEVQAYDLARGRLAWEVSLAPPGTPLVDGGATAHFGHHETAIGSDGHAVHVIFDQVVTALDPATGAERWRRPLPRQSLRRYDPPRAWTARVGDRLFAVVYEQLFVLDPDDGRLLWSFDAGPHVRPSPVVGPSAVCLATRQGPASTVGTTASLPARPPRRLVAALEITRRHGRFSIAPIERGAIPAGVPVWWSLAPPPVGRMAITVELRGGERPIALDLGGVLARDGVAYVKFASPWVGSALLRTRGRTVARARW